MDVTDFHVILITHLVGDFVMQDKDWAEKKWNNFNVLLKHVGMYTFCWFLYFALVARTFKTGSFYEITQVIYFLGITFCSHLLIDYVTSKITHDQAKHQEWGSHIPNMGFFSTIGIDQTLHYSQLFTCYYIFLTF